MSANWAPQCSLCVLSLFPATRYDCRPWRKRILMGDIVACRLADATTRLGGKESLDQDAGEDSYLLDPKIFARDTWTGTHWKLSRWTCPIFWLFCETPTDGLCPIDAPSLFAGRFVVHAVLDGLNPEEWFRMPMEGVTHVAWQVELQIDLDLRRMKRSARYLDSVGMSLRSGATRPLEGACCISKCSGVETVRAKRCLTTTTRRDTIGTTAGEPSYQSTVRV